MDPIDALIRRWRDAGVRFRPPATPNDLQRLEAFLGAPLPSEVRRFYSSANGMDPSGHDDHYVCFWPIETVCVHPETSAGNDARGTFVDVAFADFLLNSWWFSFRVRQHRIASIVCGGVGEELPDFTAFVSRYLNHPFFALLSDVTPS